jgi:hypothetical protein
MAQRPSTAAAQRPFRGFRAALGAAVLLAASLGTAHSQNVDCAALRAKIAALDSQGAARPNRYAAAARQQQGELDRTAAYARSLGCDQPVVPIFGPPLPARCQGLNAKIAQMQANLGQLEAAATSGTDRARADLIARYDAYCRAPTQARPRDPVTDFFATLFGGLAPPPQPAAPWAPPMDESPDVEPDTSPRGGSQAVCVRGCDGGFFPLHVSARGADASYLSDLCHALCPNAEAAVYTKPPNSDIDRAVSLDDGTGYMELPNALKFRSSYDSSCSCKPARQSWVEALAGAEKLLGEGRRGDIVVTPEASEQLSQARPEASTKSSSRARSDSDRLRPAAAAPGQAASVDAAASAPKPAADGVKEVVGPDGVKRRVRIIAPTL